MTKPFHPEWLRGLYSEKAMVKNRHYKNRQRKKRPLLITPSALAKLSKTLSDFYSDIFGEFRLDHEKNCLNPVSVSFYSSLFFRREEKKE